MGAGVVAEKKEKITTTTTPRGMGDNASGGNKLENR